MEPMVLAESYVHTLDPFAVEFTPGVGIRWYGLAYLAGFLIGWLLLKWLAATRRVELKPTQVGDFLTWLILGVLLGGRLGEVFFYQPDLLWTFEASFPFWGVLAIHKGGMASHGGMIGVALAAFLYARKIGIPGWHALDVTAVLAAPGLGLGRLANFINGELWGRPLPESMRESPPIWSVKYPDEMFLEGFANGPQVDRLASIVEFGADIGPREALRNAAYAGRTDVIEAITPYLTPYYPSQLFQTASDGIVLFAAVLLAWLVPRKPGIVSGVFLVVYGVLRIATEQFRGQYATEWGASTLTVAVGLSATMVVVGLVILLICSRRNVEPLGGLLPKKDRPA